MVLAGEWEGVKDLKKGFLMFKKEEENPEKGVKYGVGKKANKNREKGEMRRKKLKERKKSHVKRRRAEDRNEAKPQITFRIMTFGGQSFCENNQWGIKNLWREENFLGK